LFGRLKEAFEHGRGLPTLSGLALLSTGAVLNTALAISTAVSCTALLEPTNDVGTPEIVRNFEIS
jgi:hypothetical protein